MRKKLVSIVLALAMSLALAAAVTPITSTSSFTDVSPDSYYWKGVDWAVKQGITNGAEVTLPEKPQTNPQYDEDGVLVSTDPYIKLSYLICDRMKENTATERSKSFTGLLMNTEQTKIITFSSVHIDTAFLLAQYTTI